VLLDTATWRANPDWAAELGYSPEELDDANRRAVALAEEIRAAGEDERTPIVINGVVGPHGDGYSPAEPMSVEEAEGYHARQIETFAATAADMVTAVTMTCDRRVARAARREDPVAAALLVQAAHIRRGGVGHRAHGGAAVVEARPGRPRSRPRPPRG